MRLNSNKILVSVFQSSQSLEANTANHNKAIEMLTREAIPFQVVKGVYKGSSELSFLLSSDSAQGHFVNQFMALNLGRLFNQESILEVHNDNTAQLLYLNGTTIANLGEFSEVSEQVALGLDSYTFEPLSQRYFAVI